MGLVAQEQSELATGLAAQELGELAAGLRPRSTRRVGTGRDLRRTGAGRDWRWTGAGRDWRTHTGQIKRELRADREKGPRADQERGPGVDQEGGDKNREMKVGTPVNGRLLGIRELGPLCLLLGP